MNLESPQQTGYVDRLEHGVHVDTATIRGQHGQTQALKPAGIPVVLVQKIGNFPGKVARPWQGSKAHLSSATKSCHIRAPQPMLRSPPPRSLCVISRLRWARAQMLQRIPRHLLTSEPSSRAPSLFHHRSARNGYVTVCPLGPDSTCQSSCS